METVTELFASMNHSKFFGFASALLSIFAFIWLIFDTVAGHTQPKRASWTIWLAVALIAFFSPAYHDTASTLWFIKTQVVGSIIVLGFAVWVRRDKHLHESDYATLALASVAVLLLSLTNNSIIALAVIVTVSVLGGISTLRKSYKYPRRETLMPWVLLFLASACALLSIDKPVPSLLAYPSCFFLIYLALIVVILQGRSRRKSGKQRSITTASRRQTSPRLNFRSLGVFSGLRTISHAIMLCAISILAVSWFDANSTVKGTASAQSINARVIRAIKPDVPDNTFDIVPPDNETIATIASPSPGFKLATHSASGTQIPGPLTEQELEPNLNSLKFAIRNLIDTNEAPDTKIVHTYVIPSLDIKPELPGWKGYVVKDKLKDEAEFGYLFQSSALSPTSKLGLECRKNAFFALRLDRGTDKSNATLTSVSIDSLPEVRVSALSDNQNNIATSKNSEFWVLIAQMVAGGTFNLHSASGPTHQYNLNGFKKALNDHCGWLEESMQYERYLELYR